MYIVANLSQVDFNPPSPNLYSRHDKQRKKKGSYILNTHMNKETNLTQKHKKVKIYMRSEQIVRKTISATNKSANDGKPKPQKTTIAK